MRGGLHRVLVGGAADLGDFPYPSAGSVPIRRVVANLHRGKGNGLGQSMTE